MKFWLAHGQREDESCAADRQSCVRRMLTQARLDEGAESEAATPCLSSGTMERSKIARMPKDPG